MHGRLAALPATKGCLDLDQIETLEKSGVIDLTKENSFEEIATLRDFLRSSMEQADARLAELFWRGEDVVESWFTPAVGLSSNFSCLAGRNWFIFLKTSAW